MTGFPYDPHQVETMSGWHTAEARGNWDFETMQRELGSCCIHSRCKGHFPSTSAPTDWDALVFSPEAELFIVLLIHTRHQTHVMIWTDTPDRAQKELLKLSESYLRKADSAHDDTASFHIVLFRQNQPDVAQFFVRPNIQTEDELALHFGKEFIAWHKDFMQRICSRRHGVTILQGPPGTGKTTYLRHLLLALRESHQFYYLPPTAYPLLSSPSCFDFWVSRNRGNKGSIVIIEDAEELLLERDSQNRDSVASLLGLGDGFLSDALRLHVICSANAAVTTLDRAILRPGRLVASRQFRRLTRKEAEALADSKGIQLADGQIDFSLAESYHRGSTLSQLAAPSGFRALHT